MNILSLITIHLPMDIMLDSIVCHAAVDTLCVCSDATRVGRHLGYVLRSRLPACKVRECPGAGEVYSGPGTQLSATGCIVLSSLAPRTPAKHILLRVIPRMLMDPACPRL